MIIANGKTIVLKDSANSGTVTSSGAIGQAVNNGTIKIESGNYVSTASTYAFWAGGKNQTGTIIVDNGEITAQEGAISAGKDSVIIVNNGVFNAKDNAVLASNGTAEYAGANITVNGGTFNGAIQTPGYTGCGVYFPNNGVLTINGGIFNIAGVCVAARAGEVYINGGDFYSSVDTAGWVGDKKTQLTPNGVFYDGAANYPGLADNAKLKITGGTFTNSTNTEVPAVKVTQPTNGISINVEPGDWSVAE